MTEPSIRSQFDAWFDAIESHELRKLRTAVLCVENGDLDEMDAALDAAEAQWEKCRSLAWQQVVEQIGDVRCASVDTRASMPDGSNP